MLKDVNIPFLDNNLKLIGFNRKQLILEIMKKSKVKLPEDTSPRIKVQLDYRTVITVKTTQALDMWLTKYPEAKVLEK